MEVDAEPGCGEGFGALGEVAGDDAGEDVAAASCGEQGVGEGAEGGLPLGCGDDGVGAFEDDDAAEALGCGPGGAESVALDVGDGGVEEAGHFPWVGGEDDAGMEALGGVVHGSEGVECVGIDDDASGAIGGVGEGGPGEGAGVVGEVEAWAEDGGAGLGPVVAECDGGFACEGAFGARGEGQPGGFGEGASEPLDELLGGGDGDEAGTGAIGAGGGEGDGAAVTPGPADDEHASEGAFVGIGGALGEVVAYPAGGDEFEGDGFGCFFGDADVDDLDASDGIAPRGLVHADFGQAEGDGEVGGNEVGIDGAGVAIEAGWDIDGDDFRWLVAGAGGGECGEGPRDGVGGVEGEVLSDAEEGVDDEVGGGELGGELLAGGVGGAVDDGQVAGSEFVEAGGLAVAFGEVDGDVGAPVVEVAGGDEAVAAVVAGAGEDEDVAAFEGAEEHPGFLGDGEPGFFHELGFA